jgi:hypothetical protein
MVTKNSICWNENKLALPDICFFSLSYFSLISSLSQIERDCEGKRQETSLQNDGGFRQWLRAAKEVVGCLRVDLMKLEKYDV